MSDEKPEGKIANITGVAAGTSRAGKQPVGQVVQIKGIARPRHLSGKPVLCTLCNIGIKFEVSDKVGNGRQGKGCTKIDGLVVCAAKQDDSHT